MVRTKPFFASRKQFVRCISQLIRLSSTRLTMLNPTKTVYLITSGDLRLAANRTCWPAQAELERRLTVCLADRDIELRRAAPIDPVTGHGFISSQRQGMDVFLNIPAEAPLIVAIAAWQYTHHVLPGLRTHRGPLLTVANWSGQWPGLVGLLNLNGSLVKAGVPFSTLWSEQLDDAYFLAGLEQWLTTSSIHHDVSHVHPFDPAAVAPATAASATRLAAGLRRRKAILGVFDEGCMGMYNAILDDELLNPLGIFKERLSQSALVARMQTVRDQEAAAIRTWLEARGFQFHTGPDPAVDLTDAQILDQARMYIATGRIAHDFGCHA